jgi:hypothetical protein
MVDILFVANMVRGLELERGVGQAEMFYKARLKSIEDLRRMLPDVSVQDGGDTVVRDGLC